MYTKVNIEEISEKIGIGPFGSDIKVSTFKESGVPIISGTHLKKVKLQDRNKFNFISEDHAHKLKNSIVFPGDVIFTHAGNVENVSYIPEDSKYKRYIISQRQFYFRPNKKKINPIYLAYFFNTKYGKYLISANASSVGVPSIAQPVSYLKSININIPSLKYQSLIVNLLQSFDDKIELSNQINFELNEFAKKLFNFWFIDFVPIIEKNNKLSNEILNLFPNSFEKTKIGNIPKGWKISKIGDHIKIIKGKSYSSSDLLKSNTALVTLKSFKRNGGYREDGLKDYVGLFKEEQITKDGDLIVALTDVTQEGDVIGKPAIVIGNEKYDNLVISCDVAILKNLKESILSKSFIYYLMLTYKYAQNSIGYTNGTNVLHLEKEAITDFTFALPNNQKLVEKFDDISLLIQKKISMNSRTNNVLLEIKNIFLPKLISGELKIVDAKKLISEINI